MDDKGWEDSFGAKGGNMDGKDSTQGGWVKREVERNGKIIRLCWRQKVGKPSFGPQINCVTEALFLKPNL